MSKIRLVAALMVVSFASLVGCKEAEIEEVKVSLNKSIMTLSKGQTEQLTPTITPSTAKVDLSWSSADKTVATVSSDGDVTGVAAGETVITVSAGEASATCKVTVKPTAVEEIVLDKDSAEMTIGDQLTLKASVLPADADDAVVTWKSLNESVATVDSKGVVTAIQEGSATILATAGGKNAQCQITVKKPFVHVESVKITKSVNKLVEGETFDFEATVTPDDATDKSVRWESSNTAILTINASGKATAVKSGTVEVTVKTVDGDKTDKCSVEVEAAYVPVSQVELVGVSGTVNLVKGDVHTFTVKVTPEDATDKTIVWSVSDEKVITVDQTGKVTAVGGGNAKVVATAKDGGKYAECHVSVTVPVTGVTLDKATAELVEGEELVLTAVVNPSDASDKSVTWSSSDNTVATVVNGKVTALKVGIANISVATADGGKTATCQVKVTAQVYPVTGVTLDRTSAEIVEGDELTLNVTVSPANATNKDVSWTSSDNSVATVSGGKVTALKAGNTKITVTTSDGGKTAVCDVTVIAREYPVTGVALDKTSLEMEEGDTVTLTATISPANATNKNVSWSSSDNTVATVEDGKVTALKGGAATITVTTADGGKTASCDVVVKSTVIKVVSVEISSAPANLSMHIGDEYTFAAKVLPENATDKSVTWKSSATEVVTIDETGKAKALAAGESVITVISTDGSKTASVTVKVYEPVVEVSSIEITSKPSSNMMTVGDSFTFTAAVKPENATDKTLKWSSNNSSVLSIEASTGKAKAKIPGEATITVKSADEKVKAEVFITVKSPESTGTVTSVTLSTEGGIDFVRHGKTIQIIPSYSPAGAYPNSSKWYTSHPDLVTVDNNGLVKAINFDYSQKHSFYSQNGYPEVTISNQVDETISSSIKLKILPAVPEKILVQNPPPSTMTIGDSWDMGQITILPEEAEQSVQIICTYDGNYGGALGHNFTAGKVGNMAILIAANGEHAQAVHTGTDINYSVRVEPLYESSVTLSHSSYTLEAGSSFSLISELLPSNATYKDVSWSSSNTSVATVNGGVVKAHSQGTTEISVKTHHGMTAKCSVTVTSKTSTVSVGDYYYSDGTTSSELQNGKTPVGIVFALADAAGSDPATLGKEHSGVTHGLVVGLESYNTPISVTAYVEGMPMDKVAMNAVSAGMIDMTNRTALCGYSNTKAMKTWGEWVILDVCASTSTSYALSSSTSGWYIPSLGEIDLLGDVYSVVNEKLEAIKPEYKIDSNHEFWCSTFFGVAQNSYTYKISAGDLTANVSQGVMTGAAQISSKSKYVRFIFAF